MNFEVNKDPWIYHKDTENIHREHKDYLRVHRAYLCVFVVKINHLHYTAEEFP